MAGRRGLFALLGLLLGMSLVGFRPGDTAAHAALASSEPPSNEIVAQSPGRVELRFTEPIEETYTRVILVDETGAELPGTAMSFDSADRTVARLVIPDDLPRGTYSVVWRTLSAADGHRFSGYFVFTIGSTADVRTVVAPEFDESAGPPFWVTSLVRWFSFVTLSLLAGIWLTWIFVIRPALAPVWQIGPTVVSRVKRYALLVGLLYLISALLALITQVSGQSEGAWISALKETLNDTRWGRMWVLRIIYGAMITIVFMIAAWWWPKRRLPTTAGVFLLSALLPMPLALVSHASAQSTGRREAMFADYAHLLAMAGWLGGLAVLAVTLTASGDLQPAGRKAFLTRAIPRFTAVALTCWAALGLTGLYSGYLQVGTWDGLFDTDYGRALLYKLLVLAGVLAIAAVNMTIVSRRLRTTSTDGASGWWRRFSVLVGLEIVGILIALIFVGRLTGLEPSRPVLAERENQSDLTVELGDRSGSLSIAPGSAGPNHFRLDVSGNALPDAATATILLVPPVDMAGNKSVPLEHTGGNTFEAHSAEMSVVGNWTMTVTVSQPGAFQWSADVAFAASERQPGGVSINMPSWTIDRTGLIGFLAIMAGVVCLSIGWRAGNRSLRREGMGLGAVAIVAGALLVFTGRTDVASAGIPLDTPNPVPATDEAIQVGAAAYAANCVACHGTGGAGDGPSAGSMTPPPANLLEGHALYHSDAEFFNWIRNGKPGTAMPGFSNSLSDDEIWSTIHYIRQLQTDHAQSPDPTDATPSPVP